MYIATADMNKICCLCAVLELYLILFVSSEDSEF